MASRALEAPAGVHSVRAGNAGAWISRAGANAIVTLTTSTWWAILVVALAIGCVAYADNMGMGVSLGYLYDSAAFVQRDSLAEEIDVRNFGALA